MKLSERQVTDLLAELQQSDPAQLVCEDVCRSVYSADNPLSANPQGFTFDNCTLTIDGELTGDPAHIVGALKCDGHAIAYYCEGRRPLGHIEHPLAEMLSNLGNDLLGQPSSPIEHGHHHTEQVQGRIHPTIPKLVEQSVDR